MTAEDLDNGWVLNLHPHVLRATTISGSFACGSCGQLRYHDVRACTICKQALFCTECYDREYAVQRQCMEQVRVETGKKTDSEKLRRLKYRRPTSSPGGTPSTAVMPPLLQACIGGDASVAKEIVEKREFQNDLDLEAVMPDGPHVGRTAIHLAAQHGHRKIVQLLLSRATQRDAIDNAGMTPLMHAAYNGHASVVDELLFVGVDRIAFCGYTSMLFAASRGHEEAVRRLMAAGASPVARTPLGRNALIVAAFNGHLDVVKCLVDVGGIELDAHDHEGYSAVDAALASNHLAVAQYVTAALERQKALGE
jgi:ankyrin repeat protein